MLNHAVLTACAANIKLHVQDEIVPFAHMEKLRAASKAPVTWLENAASGHMDAYMTDSATYWRTMQKFWHEHVESAP